MHLAVRLVVTLVFTALLTSACGESATAPSSQIPQVAGTYTGSIALSSAGRTLGSGTARMTVVQAGSELTITGSVTISGATVQIRAVTGTINRTGFFTPARHSFTNRVTDPTCGTITPVDVVAFSTYRAVVPAKVNDVRATVRSASKSSRLDRTATTFCGTWQFSGTLRRQ